MAGSQQEEHSDVAIHGTWSSHSFLSTSNSNTSNYWLHHHHCHHSSQHSLPPSLHHHHRQPSPNPPRRTSLEQLHHGLSPNTEHRGCAFEPTHNYVLRFGFPRSTILSTISLPKMSALQSA
ncbi:hypothetical protein CsSME_00042668 [Camellia sinensis var. sinensis]